MKIRDIRYLEKKKYFVYSLNYFSIFFPFTRVPSMECTLV